MNAEEIVGKVMSIPDELMPTYVRLATDWKVERQLEAIEALSSNELHPRDMKMEIARNIASQMHGAEKAGEAAREFDRVFRERMRPEKVQKQRLSEPRLSVLDALLACDIVKSRSEGRRLIDQGGVHIDGRLVTSVEESLDLSSEVPVFFKVGKRRYFELLSESRTT